jgi:hypothetical protein
MRRPIVMIFCLNIMPPEPISKAYFINPPHQWYQPPLILTR